MNDVAIDTPGGLLFEWWSMFWDISIAKTKEKRSESAVEQGLNVYIYDYLVKKKLYHTAESFMPPLRVIFVCFFSCWLLLIVLILTVYWVLTSKAK